MEAPTARRAGVMRESARTGTGRCSASSASRRTARAHRVARWQLAGLYVDNDVSAYCGKPRPEYLRMLGDLEAKRIDAVVAWHPDRLHLVPARARGLRHDRRERRGGGKPRRRGGRPASPSGRMVARMLGAAARYEVEHKCERGSRKARQRAEQGHPNKGGTRPFGLSADWSEIVPGEADALRDAAERVLAGTPLYTIAREWDAKGLQPPRGGRWTVTSLSECWSAGARPATASTTASGSLAAPGRPCSTSRRSSCSGSSSGTPTGGGSGVTARSTC